MPYPTGHYIAKQDGYWWSGSTKASSWANPVDFVTGSTEPYINNIASPAAGGNVGWDGNFDAIITTDYTIPAGQTLSNKIIHAKVTCAAASSVMTNCMVDGRAPNASQVGQVNGALGGTLNNCTITTTHANSVYYENGLNSTGGNWTLNQCAINRCTDSLRKGSGTITANGCVLGPFGFRNDDANQSGGTPQFWTHADGFQSTGVGGDTLFGCSVHGRADVTGVTWTGTPWSTATAVDGATSIGMPATMLNFDPGYRVQAYPGTYGNGFIWTGSSATGILIDRCWLNGGDQALIRITVAANAALTLNGNRFRLNCKPLGSGRIQNVQYPSSATLTLGALPNVYDVHSSVPDSLQGVNVNGTDPVLLTSRINSTGISVFPANYS